MLALETSVWEALARGDTEADRAALSPDFLGVYPSGFSDREGHVSQLDAGPSIAEYALSETRIQVYAPDLAMLSYRARFRRGQDWHDRCAAFMIARILAEEIKAHGLSG